MYHDQFEHVMVCSALKNAWIKAMFAMHIFTLLLFYKHGVQNYKIIDNSHV